MFKFRDLVEVVLKDGKLPRVRTSFCGFSIPPCYSKGRNEDRGNDNLAKLLTELRSM